MSAPIVISSVFAIIINTEQGVRNVDRRLLEVARSFRSTERQLWADVRVGDATLDNTNFGGRGAGQRTADRLPHPC